MERSTILVATSTISMAIFNSKLLVYPIKSPFIPFISHKIPSNPHESLRMLNCQRVSHFGGCFYNRNLPLESWDVKKAGSRFLVEFKGTGESKHCFGDASILARKFQGGGDDSWNFRLGQSLQVRCPWSNALT